MQGGSHARWITRGELREVGLTRDGLREVDYARYESPSEMFHSLIFNSLGSLLHYCDYLTCFQKPSPSIRC